jgi:hypothetical protein
MHLPQLSMACLSSNRPASSTLRLTLTTILGILLTTAVAAAAVPGQEIEEYQFKAAFLYNVAKFVEWPPGAFKGPNDPIVSCILGETPLDSVLEQGAKGKTVGDRKFVMRHISDVRQASGCHILFVSASERKRWRSIFEGTKNSGILTVGESDGFATEGGVINFKLDGDKIRIQVNLEAANQEGLRLSSRLLSLSQIVKG